METWIEPNWKPNIYDEHFLVTLAFPKSLTKIRKSTRLKHKMLPFLITNYKLLKIKIKEYKTRKMAAEFFKLHNHNLVHHHKHWTCQRMSREEVSIKEKGEKKNLIITTNHNCYVWDFLDSFIRSSIDHSKNNSKNNCFIFKLNYNISFLITTSLSS